MNEVTFKLDSNSYNIHYENENDLTLQKNAIKFVS